MKYKKYIVFAFDKYYPVGGLEDIADSFDKLKDAEAYVVTGSRHVSEIVDRDTWEIVWKSYE
jgi:hypothetical protein